MSGLLFHETGQPTGVSVAVKCQGPTSEWIVTCRGREFSPCAFDAREQQVWIVCRPTDLAPLDSTVEVGDLALLACDSAIVITAWSPESFSSGLSTDWTGGALVPNSTRVTQPNPPIGRPGDADTPFLPQGYERNAEGCHSPETSDEDDPEEALDESSELSESASDMDELDEEEEDEEDESHEPANEANDQALEEPAPDDEEDDDEDDGFDDDL